MDGTLVDSEHYWMKAERELASRYPGDWHSEDGLAIVGLSLYESAKIMKQKMQIHDMQPIEIMNFLTETVVSGLRTEIPWRPGARELLLELRQAGIKTALVTMSLRRMALEVANSVGFDAFDVVVAGDDVTLGKPHPEPYLKAAEFLGVDINHCIAIEDSNNGLKSAIAAGTVALGIPNFVELEASDACTIWPTLEGVTVDQLSDLCIEKTGF